MGQRLSFLSAVYICVQVNVSMEMEDNDPKNDLYRECFYAGGLSEYISWLNADKVRLWIQSNFLIVVGSLSDFMLGDAKLQCGNICYFENIH